MRVTNNYLINKLSRNMNSTTGNLAKATVQVSSGKKFLKSSEDTLSAVRAYRVRQDLSRNSVYTDNIEEVQGYLDQSETTLMGIKEILVNAKENLVQSSNGTMTEENRKITSDIFKGFQSQLLQLSNTNYAGKYIFGGSNISNKPFTIKDGKMFYNGQDCNSDSVKGEGLYIDLGLGLSTPSGVLDKGSAFSISILGSDALGTGIDSDGMSNNIYNLFSDIIKSLDSGDVDMIQKQAGKLEDCTDNVMVQIAGIGEKVEFVDFISDRLSTTKLNLTEKQSSIEDLNLAMGMTDYTSAQLTYMASIQMGAKIMQKSLLDFLS